MPRPRRPQRTQTIRLTVVIALLTTACSSGDDDGGTEIRIDDQIVVDPEAVAAARDQIENDDDVEAATAPVETEPPVRTDDSDDDDDADDQTADEAPETTIAVAEADEDELDSLLNALTVFNGCLADDGFEFMGAPGIDGATAEQFEQPYLQSLGRCAAVSNIAQSIQSFSESQANLTPEEIEQTNFGLPVFRECLIGLGWTVGELTPDERGALGFDGQLQPPDGADGFATEDISDCRLEAEQYVADNFDPDA